MSLSGFVLKKFASTSKAMKVKEVTDKVDKASTKFASTMMGDSLTRITDVILFLILGAMYYAVIPHEGIIGTPYADMPNSLASFFYWVAWGFGAFHEILGTFVKAIGGFVWVMIKLFIVAPYSLWVNYFSPQVGFQAIQNGMINFGVSFLLMCTWMIGWIFIWSGIINSWEKGLKTGFKIVIYMTAISVIPYVIVGVIKYSTGQCPFTVQEISLWHLIEAFWNFFKDMPSYIGLAMQVI